MITLHKAATSHGGFRPAQCTYGKDTIMVGSVQRAGRAGPFDLRTDDPGVGTRLCVLLSIVIIDPERPGCPDTVWVVQTEFATMGNKCNGRAWSI